MINRILAIFGLVRISRARTLTLRLHEHYVQCVQDGVKRDFGATPSLTAFDQSRQWWQTEFDRIMVRQCDDVEITTKPIFSEFV